MGLAAITCLLLFKKPLRMYLNFGLLQGIKLMLCNVCKRCLKPKL
jgi:hypothetical protein